MRIAVHGATGAQGGPVTTALARAGHEVVALSRNPVDSQAASFPADLEDQDSLERAYAGVDGVFVHLPIPMRPDDPARWAGAVIGAIAANDVNRVVVSTSGASLRASGPHPVMQGRFEGNVAFYEGLRGVAGSVVALAPRLFLENLLLPFVSDLVSEQGVLAYPLAADKLISWISHGDVGEAVSAAFEEGTAPGIYDMGMDAITGPELASRIGDGLGRELRYDAVTPTEFARRATPLFGPEAAGAIGGLYEAYADDATLEIGPDQAQLATDRRISVVDWARQTLRAA